MRFLFIYPNVEQNAALPQVGISQLSACLKAAGHKVSLLDFTYLDLDEAEALLEEELERFRPGAVGISIRSFEWEFVRTRLLPVLGGEGLPVIVGGPHPTAVPEEVMAEAAVTHLVRGEGEEVLIDLVADIESGRQPRRLEGCWVRAGDVEPGNPATARDFLSGDADGGVAAESPLKALADLGTVCEEGFSEGVEPDRGDGIIRSNVRRLNQDLDALPLPDWDIWDKRHFVESHSRIFTGGLRHIGALETSRGCPYACPYCISPMLHDLYRGKGKYHREKSVERIIAEVLDKKDRFGLDYVNIIDETFLLRDSRIREFCARWLEEVNLPFRFTTRPETVTEERISLVAEAGADVIGLGIESGDPEYRRKYLNRGYSQEQVIDAVTIIKKHGIKVFGFFVMGMPYETRANIGNTLELIGQLRRLGLDHYMVTLCYPFKGTPFYEVAVRDGLLETDLTGVPNVWEDTPLSLPGLSREQLVRLRSLVSYFGSKPPRWRPLMHAAEKNSAAFWAWKAWRKLERRLSHSDIL